MKFLISNMFVLIVMAFLLVTKLLQSQEDIILSGNAILIALPAKVSVSVPPVAGVSRQSTLKNHYRTIKPENSFLIDPYNPFSLLEVPS